MMLEVRRLNSIDSLWSYLTLQLKFRQLFCTTAQLRWHKWTNSTHFQLNSQLFDLPLLIFSNQLQPLILFLQQTNQLATMMTMMRQRLNNWLGKLILWRFLLVLMLMIFLLALRAFTWSIAVTTDLVYHSNYYRKTKSAYHIILILITMNLPTLLPLQQS